MNIQKMFAVLFGVCYADYSVFLNAFCLFLGRNGFDKNLKSAIGRTNLLQYRFIMPLNASYFINAN